jgi:hypothetical protein
MAQRAGDAQAPGADKVHPDVMIAHAQAGYRHRDLGHVGTWLVAGSRPRGPRAGASAVRARAGAARSRTRPGR